METNSIQFMVYRHSTCV